MSQQVQIVKAVQEAKSRIFKQYDQPFFSKYVWWEYIEISDSRTCDLCHAYGHGRYNGAHIRGLFPELEIYDAETIKVNKHINCRCVLVRIMMEEPS